MDKFFGRIEDALIDLGLRENTLMIFTGDNGTNSAITSNLSQQEKQGGKGFSKDHGTHVSLVVNKKNKMLIIVNLLFPYFI